MGAVHEFLREVQLARIVGEVEPVDVVDVAVAVVVDAVARDFARVDPHVGGQVFVVVFHALVDHGDDHVGIARRELPCGVDVGIGTHTGLLRVDVARVVVVPLHELCPLVLVEGERYVAHLVADGTRRIRIPGRGGGVHVIRRYGRQRVLDDGDVLAGRKHSGHLGRRDGRVVLCIIPQMQPFLAGAFLEASTRREKSFEPDGADRCEHPVDLVDAAACRYGARGTGLFYDARCFVLEFEDDLAVDGRRGGVYDDGPCGVLTAVAPRFFLGARCQCEYGCGQE